MIMPQGVEKKLKEEMRLFPLVVGKGDNNAKKNLAEIKKCNPFLFR